MKILGDSVSCRETSHGRKLRGLQGASGALRYLGRHAVSGVLDAPQTLPGSA